MTASRRKTPLNKPPPRPRGFNTAEDVEVLKKSLLKAESRIRQLRREITSRRAENETIVAENLRNNEALLALNQDLEIKVLQRTLALNRSNEKLREQAARLEALDHAKESLTRMIVHDMKNPLTAVMGTLALCKRGAGLHEADLRSMVEQAHAQAKKLLGMMEEMLLISRMQSAQFTIHPDRGDLIEVIRRSLDVMTPSAAGKGLRFRFAPDGGGLPGCFDAGLIERVVNNLINNSIKYAPDGSEIPIDAVRTPEGRLTLTVTNWGEAIPLEFHEKIFDLFWRVKPEDKKVSGTGLGLAFCRLAVRAHGGSIHVLSPVPPADHGVRFTVVLPPGGEDRPDVRTP